MEHHPENCREVFALLSDYLDLELPPENCDEIKRHLADCPPCVEFVESLRKTVALCHGYEPGVKPAPLSAEVRAELETAWRKMLAAREGKTQ
jgi:anti-sigma factor RsiW